MLEGGAVPSYVAASRTVFIPTSSTDDDNGLSVRSPDAFRPLTLCNCDCEFFTTATCFGLHRYSIRCIHPAQRCRQMTENILEVKTTALAHVVCAPQESGILLTDTAAAYPSVNHSWIFRVLDKAELPGFICRFFGRFIPIARRRLRLQWKFRRTIPHGQRCQARLPSERLPVRSGVRPYLSMAPRLDPPKKPCRPTLSSTLSVCPCWWFCGGGFVFPVVDGRPVPGLSLWWWTGCLGSTSIIGSAVGHSMATIVATSCWTGWRQTVRSFAKGKWSTAPSTLALWLDPSAGRLQIFALSVLGHLGSISAPDGATVKEKAHALQCTTAGPYNACTYWPPTCWICVRPWYRPIRDPYSQPCFPVWNGCQLEHTCRRPCEDPCCSWIRRCLPVRPFPTKWNRRWLTAPWGPVKMCVTWIMLAKLTTLPAIT